MVILDLLFLTLVILLTMGWLLFNRLLYKHGDLQRGVRQRSDRSAVDPLHEVIFMN
jgi:hypothetical protein